MVDTNDAVALVDPTSLPSVSAEDNAHAARGSAVGVGDIMEIDVESNAKKSMDNGEILINDDKKEEDDNDDDGTDKIKQLIQECNKSYDAFLKEKSQKKARLEGTWRSKGHAG